MKLIHAQPVLRCGTWPQDGNDIYIKSKWRLKDDKAPGCRIRQGSVGFIESADVSQDEIEVWVNPAIVWVGSYAELKEMWEAMPIETKLTF